MALRLFIGSPGRRNRHRTCGERHLHSSPLRASLTTPERPCTQVYARRPAIGQQHHRTTALSDFAVRPLVRDLPASYPSPTAGNAAKRPSRHQRPEQTVRSRTPPLAECELSTHSSRSDFSKAVARRIKSVGDDGEPREPCGQYTASHHGINSACASNDCGIARPSAFAVLRLMTMSIFVGCSIARSPGFAPLRMRST